MNTLSSPLYVTEPDMAVDSANGQLVPREGSGVNFIPFPVRAGSILRPTWDNVRYKMFFYRPEIPPELIHTYTYQSESNWTSYAPELSRTEWTHEPCTIPENGFVRLEIARAEREYYLVGMFHLEEPPREETPPPSWRTQELNSLARRVMERRREGDVTLLLLADTHYTVGCIWPETVESLCAAAALIHPDGTVHLGDLTDGLLPERYTRLLARRILSQLEGLSPRLFCCVGNHDRNSFRGNTGRMSRRACSELYLRRKTPWYYTDYPDENLRLIFLDSFDPEEKERYGFPNEEVRWLRRVLAVTPRKRRVLVFSHVPPVAEIHVWSDTIRNGEAMLSLLERYQRRRATVLGWIHGHNHADQIYTKRAFPIIGVGCSKLEDFPEHKPEGSVTPPRQQGTSTQELWDVLLVHPEERSMDFLRFGAGEDRYLGSRSK